MEIETSRPKKEKIQTNLTQRQFIIKKAVEDINRLRIGTPYESSVETEKNLAKRINRNPHFTGQYGTGELEYILSECSIKGNYSYLYYLLK